MEEAHTTEQKPVEQKPVEQKTEPKKALAAGVQFRHAGKIYTFVTEEPALAKGDRVMIEAEGGTALATGAKPPREVSENDLPQNVKRVLRRASAKDIEEVIASFKSTGLYNQKFIDSLKKGLKRSSYFK